MRCWLVSSTPRFVSRCRNPLGESAVETAMQRSLAPQRTFREGLGDLTVCLLWFAFVLRDKAI